LKFEYGHGKWKLVEREAEDEDIWVEVDEFGHVKFR
jgi:uncharacterized protein YuzE